MADIPEEQFPASTMYARIDSGETYTSYPPFRRCIRLFGVSSTSFTEAAFNREDGAEIFVVEIPVHDTLPAKILDLSLHRFGFRHDSLFRAVFGAEPYETASESSEWLEITYSIQGRFPDSVDERDIEAVGYTAFRQSEPKSLAVQSITPRTGGPIRRPPSGVPNFSSLIDANNGSRFSLEAFHVGQGMCSLLTNKYCGVLFDAGAAKPIHREQYRAGLKRNELRDELQQLQGGRLALVLSHDDYDHWCLLEWDLFLRSTVQSIFVPEGTTNLAFRSRVIVPRVYELGDSQFSLSSDTHVKLLRTDPTYEPKKSNNNSLVAVVQVSETNALLPGDYIYPAMALDNKLAVQNLVDTEFNAVVVPHHGEELTHFLVPPPAVKECSIAFFSAGTYKNYKHPSSASVQAHMSVGYRTIVKNYLKTVRAVRLL